MKEMVGGCCVCSDERGWSENPLVYCDGHGCNVAVHQACYGIVSVPTGPWFCRKCESQERAARVVGAASRKSQKPVKLTEQAMPPAQVLPRGAFTRCELCPQKDGALKRTDTGGWCHVVCALFVPEAWFGNVQTMEPIILKGVPPERFNKVCYVCEEQGRETKSQTGACMQCNKNGCKQHFHVTCAQSQGLLCEEQGNYMDNVKYCGYCSLHYKKLKKDSHIKTIPAFKPIPADNATPESTPEKATLSRQDRRREKLVKSQAMISETATSPRTTTDPSYPQGQGQSTNAGKDSVTDIKSTGKFTTANFRETTITPSPAHFDFSSPGSSSSTGGDGSTPTHEREKKEVKKLVYNEKGKLNDHITDVYDSDFLDVDKRKIPGILGSPSGRSVAAAKESKFSVYPVMGTNDKQPKSGQSTPSRTPPRGSGPTPASSGSAPVTSGTSGMVTSAATTTSTAAMATTVTVSTASSNVATSTTSSSQSSFSYSFKSFLNSQNYQGSDKMPSDKELDVQPAKRQRSRSTEKNEKKKSKKNKSEKMPDEDPPSLIPDLPGVSMGSNPSNLGPNSKAKTVKDLLAVTGRTSPVSPPTPVSPTRPSSSGGLQAPSHMMNTTSHQTPVGLPTVGPSAQPGPGARPRKPGKRKKSQSEGTTFAAGMPTLQPQGVYDSNPFAGGAGTTPLTLSSLSKQGANPDLTEGLTNGPSTLIGPPKPFSSSHKGLLSPGRNPEGHAQLPTSMEQLLERQWDQGSQFLMEQGQHFDIASLLNCLHQLRQENQRLEEHINNLTARRDQLLAVNARLSLPLTPLNALHPGSTPGSLAGPGSTVSSQGTSPEGSSGAGYQRNPRTNSFMPQDHANTSATQEMLSGLSGRSVLRSPAHSQATPATSRSPAHSQPVLTSSSTATHNHLPLHNQTPALSSSSHVPPHPSPETSHGGQGSHPSLPGSGSNPPGVIDISPGSGPPSHPHPPPLSDQQRQMMQMQHQQLMLNASLTPEQRQQLLYQIAASQHMPPGLLAPHPTTASSTPLRAPPPLAPSHSTSAHNPKPTEKPKDKS